MTTPISVLDIQAPVQLPELVTALDDAGFYRYWSTEHYSPGQTASPTIVVSLVAGLTHNLRVGTAGVLLRTTSAIRVAADFATLELYFPGRIDLGIAGAVPNGEHAREISRDLKIADDAGYADRVERLRTLVDPETTTIGPVRETMPQLWMCGTSERSAKIAGQLGARFAFHRSISPPQTSAKQVMDAYRDSFVPRRGAETPYCAVAAYGACAKDRATALDLWLDKKNEPRFYGDPSECADQLRALVASCGADEVVIDVFAPEFEQRLEGLTSLAKVWLS
jgi:luciferase family oxidoreductase group 1